MAIYQIGRGVPKYIGLSSDTKPTAANAQGKESPEIGSTFLEADTADLYITYDRTNWIVRRDRVTDIPLQVSCEQTIDASLGAYAAGDVVGEDDCCTTLAIPFEWDVAANNGGYVEILGALLTNETENQAVQYDILLFDTAPTGDLRDNAANDNPLKADYDNYKGTIAMPYSVAKGATVATYTEAYPGDGVSRLPKVVKCASGDTKIYGVLVTNTVYTQTAGDKILITLTYRQL